MMHLRLASRTFARFASTTSVGGTPPQPTPAAAQLPKVAPHEGVPFSAPPVDVTKGELGQIHLPDMERIEFVQQEQVKIVSAGSLGSDEMTRVGRGRAEAGGLQSAAWGSE